MTRSIDRLATATACALAAACALLAVLLSHPSQAAAFVEPGSLAQLPAPANCVGETTGAICGTQIQAGLDFAYQSAVSPNGKNVYSVAINGALIEYERNLANGALTVIGCITGGSPVGCAPANEQAEVTVVDSLAAIAISPDGKNVYLLDQDKAMVVELSRDPETGLLNVMIGSKGNPECVTGETFLCETISARGLGTPYGITVSSDGKNVYVASLGSEAVAELSRNTETGTLEEIPGHECIGASGSGCPQNAAIGLNSAIGIVVSPGGEDVYVAAGAKNTESDVAVFERNESSGVLEQLAAAEACIGTVTGCSHAPALEGAEDLAISPDGKNIYVNSYNDNAVVELARETSGAKKGALKVLGGGNECVSDEAVSGCKEVKTLLGGPLGVAISPDGKNVYVDSSSEQAVSAFARNEATGVLELLPPPYECLTTNFTGCGENQEGSVALIGFEGARRLTVSPDGTSIYIAGQSGNDLVELSRRIKPAVEHVTPAEGSEAGGTPVEIAGEGFAEGDKVVFHETEALSVTVNSSTSITAVSPPGKGAPVQLNVIAPAGESVPTASSEFKWTKLQPPTVTGLNPPGGAERGGTHVTISGTEFTPGDTVEFGETPAMGVTYESPTQISVTGTAGSGKADVRVKNAAGTSAIGPADIYAYGLLGGLDLSGYCEGLGDSGGAEVSGTGPQALDWVCVTGAHEKVPITPSGPAPSMDNACALAFPGSPAHAVTEEVTNANSWNCYEGAPEPEPNGGGGTGPGPKATTTSTSPSKAVSPGPPAVPAPSLARTGNVAPVSGTVLVKLPGSSRFVPLASLRQIPFGTVIEATHGHVSVTTAQPNGTTQTGEFFEGEFILKQGRNGVVVAELTGGNFSVCPTARERAHKARAYAAASGKHVVRKLWANAHGSFSTKGNYAAGAVQGTEWLTEDLCDGTLIRVTRDKVAVTNLVNHHHVEVTTGHRYLAKAP